MDAGEYLGTLGNKWDIENYTEMWVPGHALVGVMEGYYQAKTKEEAMEGYYQAKTKEEAEERVELAIQSLPIVVNSWTVDDVKRAITIAAFGKDDVNHLNK
jgi:hypothetical protein